MSLFLFVRNILAGEPIKIFNNGNHARDFTYIDDIVDGIIRSLFQVATADSSWSGSNPDPSKSQAPFRIYNLGNNQPVELMYFIKCIEEAIGKIAKVEMLPLQPGDVPKTCANIDATSTDLGFQPKTPIEQGIKNFVEWYTSYYNSQ
jgi:UDP-glucuronate 4-epimerase